MNVLQKFVPVTTMVFDMDGVLTDGTVLVMPDDEWIRKMHIRDGYALQLAVKSGYRVIVITGSSSEPVAGRLHKLGIQEVYQKVGNKLQLLQEIMLRHNSRQEEIMYMGDDIPDLAVMKYAGVSCCPSDACRDILEMADYISPCNGGEGCVRDVIEKIMRVQRKWQADADVAST
jgi:3-deoxy-D-manno-octulosonate 8-phosphate phosphatase (KDO 8-P phosphatase)